MASNELQTCRDNNALSIQRLSLGNSQGMFSPLGEARKDVIEELRKEPEPVRMESVHVSPRKTQKKKQGIFKWFTK